MDIHQNARLTLRSREALVEIVRRGLGLSRAAASFHVTPKTAAKWVRRYRQGGAGLRDRSSRPHHSPRATSSSRVGLVLELRRQHRPAYHIARTTGLSPATVSRILRRARLSRGQTACGRRIAPLKPKNGLNGPPARQLIQRPVGVQSRRSWVEDLQLAEEFLDAVGTFIVGRASFRRRS